jgi:hypothetical protein
MNRQISSDGHKMRQGDRIAFCLNASLIRPNLEDVLLISSGLKPTVKDIR